ncbi:hypothetical protein L6164_037647 [Bauhinia variegata]|uniref:Uncharacterized protein n=1 Tax=Bauhinia variegata TaxID=167791 RepID=A0ACB9KKT5_BAUVA|nr:hypothetical protein L6164_037647 [Bauhinia variegata]
MNIIMHNLAERIRPIVGSNGWDYCVYWKLREDQRFLEWMGCCCAGTENAQNAGEELLFPVSSVASCRDTMFPHTRTKPCGLLSQLPTSLPIDSGIHAETLLSNQRNWLNYSNGLNSSILEEAIGTQVLIPVPGGLVELFVTKQVPEDHQVIEFVTAQYTVLMEQEVVNHSVNMDASFNMDMNPINHLQPNSFLGDENNHGDHFQLQVSPTTASETSSLPHHTSLERISLCNNSPLNFMQQFNYNPRERMKSDAIFEESQSSFLLDKQTHTLKSIAANEHELQQMETYQKCMMTDTQEVHIVEPLDKKEQPGDDKDLIKHAVGRSDSLSDCSDQNDDEDDAKYRRRNGKGNQSKNLEAERKRRKKLNDRLYNLRSLVPRISKLDRASILGDAIEFVKDLQKQAKELQDELEEYSDTGNENNNIDGIGNNHVGVQPEILSQNGGDNTEPKPENLKNEDGFHVGTSGNGYISKQKRNQNLDNPNEKPTQQMEPQVEVASIEGNEFFVKVFCEHRPGGFVRLMEAFNSLGMEVIHATVTSHKGLVSNVFKVEKKDSEMVEAEDVRDSLLELTRNPARVWCENQMGACTTSSDNGMGKEYQHHHQIMGAYHPHQLHHIHNT